VAAAVAVQQKTQPRSVDVAELRGRLRKQRVEIEAPVTDREAVAGNRP
jgi:hypothetical protein